MLAVSCAKTPIAFIIGSMNVLSLHLFERGTILQWILSTSLSLFGPIVHSSPVTRMKPSGGSSVLLRLEFPCKVLPETLITAISAVSILTVLVGLGLCLKQVLPLGRLWWIRLKMMNKGLKQQPLGVKVNHGHLLSNLSTLEELWVGKVMTELNYMLLSDHCRFYYPKHPDLL